MRTTLLIACGNPLRRDDGVAHEVLRLIARTPCRELRSVQQLVPELAEEIAGFERVVFLDADIRSMHPAIEPVRAAMPGPPLTHTANPAEIVALSRALFGFHGEALVCRIPARDFSPGESLEPDELHMMREAAGELERLLWHDL
jgi:Ni,Fe-hydrogenase maturation factor